MTLLNMWWNVSAKKLHHMMITIWYKKGLSSSFLSCKHLKLKLRAFLADLIFAMVTYCVPKTWWRSPILEICTIIVSITCSTVIVFILQTIAVRKCCKLFPVSWKGLIYFSWLFHPGFPNDNFTLAPKLQMNCQKKFWFILFFRPKF